jgi:hypothetical protein
VIIHSTNRFRKAYPEPNSSIVLSVSEPMTRIHGRSIICFVCGKDSLQANIASTIAFGSPDLDTRPPQMKRSTIMTWVQRCPECGYCASQLTDASTNAGELVLRSDYREQLASDKYSELTNSFLCKSMIDLESGRLAEVAWEAIYRLYFVRSKEEKDHAL